MASPHEYSFNFFLIPPFPSFFLLLLLPLFSALPSFSTSQPYKNITLGSSLTATPRNHSYWSSPSGDFAFGFLETGTEGFLLAIWFNKISERTVVWSANRNHLVPAGSIVQLTTRGQLMLNDSRANQVWTANFESGNTTVSHASMLDTGNFVLAANNNSQPLWQSFDEPTDTILPSQVMKQDSILIARYSKTNYSDGRFHFRMQVDGHLVLYTRIVPLGAQGDPYWASGTVGSGFELVFGLSGTIYISTKNGTALRDLIPSTPSNGQDFYHRAIFEYDGVFRLYNYNKSDKAWKSVPNFIPPNICTRINSGLGGGVCGYNSYCVTGVDQRPICRCPQGYHKVDPNDEMQGCKPNFIPQSCNDSLLETNSFDFFPIENSDFPSSDYEDYSESSEDSCRRACLDDCFCAAVIYETGSCWKKKFPLSFGRVDSGFRGKALIKLRRDSSTLIPDILVNTSGNKRLVVMGLVLVCISGLLIFILLLAIILIAYGRMSKKRSKGIMGKVSVLGMNLRVFSYEELNKATSGFAEKLGSGAFATVYKGIVDDNCIDNNLVAVKKLENAVKEGDQEFKAEVSAIARTNHKNLVRLLGFCNEELHRMLVYEFMPNGSLADFLFGSSQQNWYDRIQIAIGTARGLCYLHEECKTQIIHCDIKPQNILLDECFGARISDFGLAKLLKKAQTRTMTAIRGTKGYVAPEWFRSNLPITVKVDVYSFGIVLLEIISCRRSFESEVEDENEMVLANWAYNCFKRRRVEMLVRKDEEAMDDMKTVEKLVMIAIWCIQGEPSLRPSMKKVLQMLEGVVEVSTPPDPSSFISTIQ